MPTALRRPLLAFLLGAALVAAGAAGTAAYGALNDDRVAACYVPKTGALYVIGRDGAPARCADGHVPIDWSVEGPQGPSGTFSGTFTSPNGAYSIGVTDAGIVLSGPGASARLAGSTVTIEAAGALALTSGAGTTLQAGTGLALASGNGTTLAAGKDVAVSAGKSLSVATGTNLSLGVGGATSVSTTGDLLLESAHRATLKGTQAASVESSGPVTVKGASTTVQASGLNALKGAIVQANGTPLP